MKQGFIALLFSFLFCLSNAQESIKTVGYSFCDNSMSWYICEFPNSCQNCHKTLKISLGFDTAINSKQYYSILCYSLDSSENSSKVYRNIGYLRETNDKKVYFINYYRRNDPERLVFDFNAKINDTINKWIVIKVDSIEISGFYKRRITLKFICQDVFKIWIEDIGDMTELIQYPYNLNCLNSDENIVLIAGMADFVQICVLNRNIILYQNPQYEKCLCNRH